MYGTWSLWSECDRTCGGGARVRSRSCTNPPAQFGGSDCSSLGPDKETELCNLNSCPGKDYCSALIYLTKKTLERTFNIAVNVMIIFFL